MKRFKSLYSYEPPKWKELDLSETKVPAFKDHFEESHKIIQILKENLIVARNQ